MRLDVSWMVSRMAFMPSIVRRTASPPLCATSTECRATSEERSALPETSSMDDAMRPIARDADSICFDWASLAAASWRAEPSVCLAAPSTRMALSLMVVTSSRRASMA